MGQTPDGAGTEPGLIWTPCTVTLGELQPWERNPKRLSKAQAARLLASWETLGQFQTLAIGPAGEVYDGHQRLSALLKLHGPRYTVQALRSDRPLTEREREVMCHVIAGELNKQIGGRLGIVEKTIKVHRARVMEKMGVSSVAELVRLCALAGIEPAGK